MMINNITSSAIFIANRSFGCFRSFLRCELLSPATLNPLISSSFCAVLYQLFAPLIFCITFSNFCLLYTSLRSQYKKSDIKKQSQRFALQELLKQFLVMSRHTTAVSYKLKKQSQRFALQELLKQFLAISRYTTAISY